MTNPVQFNFCPCCGTARKDGAAFCEGCGFDFSSLAAGAGGGSTRIAAVLIVVILVVAAVAAFAPRPDATTSGPAARVAPPVAAPTAPKVSREQLEQVLADVRGAVEETPESADAWQKLADALYRTSGLDRSYAAEARQAYERVLELAEDHPEAHVGLGNLAFDADAHDQAITHYQAYLELRPEDPNVRTDLGTMFLYTQRADDAIREYTLVLEAHPEFVNARFNLANAYHVKGEREQALTIYTEVLESPGITADLRTAVQQLIARLEGRPPPATSASGELPPGHPPLEGGQPSVGPAVGSEAARETAAPISGSALQQEIQTLLVEHPIFGPKIVNFSWDTETQGKVWVAGFPMDQMPVQMREGFVANLSAEFEQIRKRHDVDGRVVVEVVDEATGSVMEAIEG